MDDNSPDGTGQVADCLAERMPGVVQVMHRPGKEGLGRAYVEGFGRALRDGADYIIQMDADLSHPPAAIPIMLDLIPEYDVVVGSRYVDGGQLDERWSWWRRLLSWWANEVWSRRILGLTTRDITAGFKCWRRSYTDRHRAGSDWIERVRVPGRNGLPDRATGLPGGRNLRFTSRIDASASQR